ncbi:MAG: hypothetical protein HFF17_03830 [Oscillospiraceae bacterium]|nr:hypothetical protein [Oscillospiraceae bacterium]
MIPEGFARRMRVLLGSDGWRAFAAVSDRPRAAALRLNRLKCAVPPDLGFLGLRPVPWAADGYYYDPAARPGLHPYHDAGLYYLQEASAMAPAGLLDVKPGQRVLDLCAAPGGKSGQIAALLAGTGLLVSNELNPRRAAVLARNLERLGAAGVLVLSEHPRRLAGRFAGYFDRVLVDAPCSGEGMFRREEAAARDWSEGTVAMCARRQGEILRSAAAMVRPGGRLVYSTCTFAPEEDEGVVSDFLKTHPDFSIAAVEAPWFEPGRPDWIADPAPGLERAVRLWPHRLLGEGHFAAALVRAGDAPPAALPEEPAADVPPQLPDFCARTGAAVPEGRLIGFAGRLWLAPAGLPALAGLKVLRPGLELGEPRKDRLEPAHAWAMWLKACGNTADFPADSRETAAYLAGETVPGGARGWTLVTADGLSLGWAKGSGGVLKNHLPKGLRRAGR